MTTYLETKSPVRKLVELLRAELAWYPGRPALVGRMVLACTSVMVLAEVFRIPGAVLGVGFPILISRESLQATRKTAFHIGLACSIATAEVIVGGMLTAGSPFLHVLWVMASLFALFYALSSLNFVNASLTAGAVLALAIRTWDYPISAEERVERTLYTWLSILLACVVTVLIETLFAKKNPPDPVLDGVSRRLNLIETLLLQTSAADFPSSTLTTLLARSAAKGVDDLCQVLATPRYESGFHELLATVVALTRQLTELGSNFAESTPTLSVEDQQRCLVTARNLGSIRAGIARLECPAWIDLSSAIRASNPILMEIERTTDLIAQSFCHESFRIYCSSPATAQARSIGEFIADALRNTEHTKFAVRGTLSTLLCYLFYMSSGWMGLAAPSILTCALTARPLTGAGRHRQSLRFMGFLTGAGVIGWGTEVFILPQLNTIAEYAVLFASVVWIGAWIAASGPRIAFFGFQIVLSYSLVNLNTFTINTSLVPARDAVLGVVLGVVAMWLIFDHLWAKTSSASVRSLLLDALRSVANFKAASAGSSLEASQRLTAESSRINREFDKLRDLADFFAFESFPKKPHESLVNRSIRTLLPDLRVVLLVKTGLLQQKTAGLAETDEALLQKVEDGVSDVLHGLASAIEGESPAPLSSWSMRADELRAKASIEETKARDEKSLSSVLHGLASVIEGESPEPLSSWSMRADELRAKASIEETKARDEKNLSRRNQMRLCASLLDLAADLEQRARLIFIPDAVAAKAINEQTVWRIAPD